MASLTLCFQGVLASGSWDRTVRTWEIFKKNKPSETYEHNSDVLAIDFRPDGKQLVSSTRDGQLTFWNLKHGAIEAYIDGKQDIAGGRRERDVRTAASNPAGKCFTRCVPVHVRVWYEAFMVVRQCVLHR